MDPNSSCELEMIPTGLDAAVAADLLSTRALALVACALLLAWSHTRQSSVPGERPALTALLFHSAMQSNSNLWDFFFFFSENGILLLQVRLSVWAWALCCHT